MGLPTVQYDLSGLDSLETKKPIEAKPQAYDLSGIDELASTPDDLRSFNEQRTPQEPGLFDRILESIPVGRLGKRIAESPLVEKVTRTPLLPATKLLPPEGVPIYLPTRGGLVKVESEVGKGILRGVLGTIEGLSTIENAAIGVAIAAAPPAVAAIGSATLAGMMASQLPDMWEQFKAANTMEQKAQVATEALAALGLTFAAGRHAAKGGMRAVTPDVGKFTSEGIAAGVREPVVGGLDAIFGGPKRTIPTELERPLTLEELAEIMPEAELRKSEVGREALRQQLAAEEAAAPVGETKTQREARLVERAAALGKELAGEEAAVGEARRRAASVEELNALKAQVDDALKSGRETPSELQERSVEIGQRLAESEALRRSPQGADLLKRYYEGKQNLGLYEQLQRLTTDLGTAIKETIKGVGEITKPTYVPSPGNKGAFLMIDKNGVINKDMSLYPLTKRTGEPSGEYIFGKDLSNTAPTRYTLEEGKAAGLLLSDVAPIIEKTASLSDAMLTLDKVYNFVTSLETYKLSGGAKSDIFIRYMRKHFGDKGESLAKGYIRKRVLTKKEKFLTSLFSYGEPETPLIEKPPRGVEAEVTTPLGTKETVIASEVVPPQGANLYNATKELATGIRKLLSDPSNFAQLNVGLGFSEAAYAKARPHFELAWRDYKASGKSFAEFSKDIVDRYGDQVAPYLSRFESEVAPRPAAATTSQVTGRSENDVRIISDKYIQEITTRAPSKPAMQNSLLLMRVKGKLQSPEHVLRNNPVALDMSSRIIDGENLVRQKYGQRMIAVDEARSGLSEGERLAVRDAAEKINDPAFAAQLQATKPKIARAAKTVRQVFDEMKDEVKQYKRVMFQLELPTRLRDAVMDVVDGRLTTEQSAVKYAGTAFPKAKWTAETRAKKLSQIINKYNNEYRNIDNWGLKDFVTNIELGIYRVVDSTGHTRAVGDTRRAATAKAKELQKTVPGIGKLSITTEGRSFLDPLQHRRDILLGEKDIFKALPSYLYAVQKKIILEPLVSEVHRVMRERPSDFPAPVKNVINSQIEYWRGKHHFGDQMSDAITTALGLRPKLWSRSAEEVRQVSANTALGYRLASAAVNIATAVGKQLVKYGVAKTVDALRWMRTEEGKRFLLEEEKQGALGVSVEVGAKGDLRVDLPWYHPLKAYTSVEPPVRRLNLATAYRQFLAEGYSDAAARIAARRAVRLINFSYNATAVPQILRSPAGRLIGQFKTYLAKEIEFMSQLTPSEWGKYLSMQMILAGPRGGILFLKSLPVLGALGYWDDIAAALEKWDAPEAAKRGAAGAIGVDVGPQATLQLTSDRVEDNFGPVLANIFRLFRDVIVPTFAGEGDVQGRAIDWASSLAPMVQMTDQLIDATVSEDGWIKDSNGNYLYNPSSELDKIKLLAGATPVELSKARTLLGIERKRAEVAKRNAMNAQKRVVLRLNKADQSLSRLTTAIVKGIDRGVDLPDDMVVDIVDLLAVDNQLDDRMKRDIAAFGITSEAIHDRIELSRTPPEARAVIRAKLIRKAEAAGLLLQ